MNKRLKSKVQHWQKIALCLVLYDVIVMMGAYLFALWIRFDCKFSEIPNSYFTPWLKFSPIYVLFGVVVFWLLHLYQSLWRFASFNELSRILISSVITALFHFVGITLFFQRMPISYFIFGTATQFLLIVFVRFAYRFVLLQRNKNENQHNKKDRVMLIGAGNAGEMILRDINRAQDTDQIVCCFIDDNKNKWGRYIDGVPIVGGRDDILLNVEKYNIQRIYLAIPSASTKDRRDILDICKETSCELKILPEVYKHTTHNISVSEMKTIDINDLLGRESVSVDMGQIYELIANKVVLVTGGGGSIGSELCRQIVKSHPKKLIIFDIYENNAHAIGLELKDKYPELDLEILIGSVRDSRRVNQVFKKFKPEIVYHAAAHKHVPLMEDSPCEAIKNNAIGTYKTAYAALKNGCKRFVLISTDKAVNPTNIMGASKRLCEMIIQMFDYKIRQGKPNEILPLFAHYEDAYGSMENIDDSPQKHTTEFVAVRFGNVLGSNGSVIPRFKEQIAKGGPVTVTHPDIIRYFMTIPEAVMLVLQAGAYAHGGEIFVLDMGEPVKIDTLARNLIKLYGLKPDEDIKISYVGLRPGEKLYEEKLMEEEGLLKTANNLIYIGKPIPFDFDEFSVRLHELMDIAYQGNDKALENMVETMVTTYKPNKEEND